MGIWNKSPRRDPAEIARIQAQIDADPVVQSFRAGFGSPNDPWTRGKGGIVTNPNQLRDYIRSRYGVPDGYDVGQDGTVVYTNKTPLLQQLTLASLPVTGLAGLDLLTGATAAGAGAGASGAGSGAGATAGGTLGAATPIPGVLDAAAGGATLGSGWLGPATAIPGVLDAAANGATFGNGAGASPGVPLGGVRPPGQNAGGDIASRFSDWFKDPRNLIGLGTIATALATKGNPQYGGPAADQANRMAAITEARMRRVDPLHQAVTQLAFGRLPVSSRNGLAINNVPLPE